MNFILGEAKDFGIVEKDRYVVDYYENNRTGGLFVLDFGSLICVR
jgi:hypothetical protein